MNTKEIFIIADRCACFFESSTQITCNNSDVCCAMLEIATDMILRGEY